MVNPCLPPSLPSSASWSQWPPSWLWTTPPLPAPTLFCTMTYPPQSDALLRLLTPPPLYSSRASGHAGRSWRLHCCVGRRETRKAPVGRWLWRTAHPVQAPPSAVDLPSSNPTLSLALRSHLPFGSNSALISYSLPYHRRPPYSQLCPDRSTIILFNKFLQGAVLLSEPGEFQDIIEEGLRMHIASIRPLRVGHHNMRKV